MNRKRKEKTFAPFLLEKEEEITPSIPTGSVGNTMLT